MDEINPNPLAADLGPVARVSLPIRKLPTRRLQVARLVSDTFHPKWMGIPLMLFVAVHSSTTVLQGIIWWAVCMALTVVPAQYYLYRGLRRNRFTDREVSVRSQRTPLYLISLVLLITALLVLVVFDAPLTLIATMVSLLAGGVVGMLVNLKWKISVHGGSTGTVATLLTLVFGPLALLVVVPVVIAVGWSRVVLLQHTPAQVLAGIAISSATVVLTFRVLGVI